MGVFTAVKIILLLFNPIIVSVVIYAAGGWALWSIFRSYNARTRAVARKALIATAICLLFYAAYDTALAYQRVQYGKQIPNDPVVSETIPTPSSLVLVNMRCDQKCLDRLIAGIHSEVIYISTLKYEENVRSQLNPPYPALRYTLTRTAPNACPPDTENKLERQWGTSSLLALWPKGICPIVESVVAPEEGIFIVSELERVSVKEPAVEFTPRFLMAKPPGPISYFNALEVQRRSKSRIEVLAQLRAYQAPGYLGVPPLVGCWERPDNVLFILPLGDAGCGLWRRLTESSNQGGQFFEGDWVYAKVFRSP